METCLTSLVVEETQIATAARSASRPLGRRAPDGAGEDAGGAGASSVVVGE